MLIFSIIGTLIGAGFASGQEMYLFFYRFGLNGILGLVLCSMLISIVIYKTFLIIHTREIYNYEDFLREIFHSEKLSNISNIIVNAFLLITFYIMISGFGAYFEQQFEIYAIIGAIILATISFVVLIKDIDGVKRVNSIVVPVLIVVILIIGFLSLKNIYSRSGEIWQVNLEDKFSFDWILQSIVYCSYNMILVIPVLVNLGKYIRKVTSSHVQVALQPHESKKLNLVAPEKSSDFSYAIKNKKQILVISILSGTIVLVLSLSIFLVLASMNVDYLRIQMPAVYAIDNNFPQFSGVYGIVILLSIFSTAISIGISFLKNITKNKNSYPQFVAIMCISGVLISNFGFSNLVKILFPVFGYLGIVEIIWILKTNE
ncbi:MAG: hypothetical protein IJK18_03005 [Clostridia bacterium]|nr:hypothetical protein [Clostridia bacterium]